MMQIRSWRLAAWACLVITGCGGSDGGADEDAGPGGMGGAGGAHEHEHAEGTCAATGLDFAAGDATAGAEVYTTRCASCHGADGEGQPDAAAEGSRGADLHEHVAAGMSDDCWVQVIREGADDMAPVAGLTDAQITDVIAYLNATFAHTH